MNSSLKSLTLAALLFAAIFTLPSIAAVEGEIQVDEICDYFGGGDIPKKVFTFSSNQEAEDVIKRILDSRGLAPHFTIKAAAVPNAAAIIREGERYILYNPNFIYDIERSTGSKAASVSILAHEIAHHLNAHTLDNRGSRPSIELEADEWSGHVMGLLGYTRDEALLAIRKLGNESGSSTHPAKRDRLIAITSGWLAAREASSSTSQPEPEPKPKRCKYENDGACDVPGLCPRGTDVDDCSARQQKPRSQQQPVRTNICCCGLGPQQFPGQSFPVGWPCTCGPDAFGMVHPGQGCL